MYDANAAMKMNFIFENSLAKIRVKSFLVKKGRRVRKKSRFLAMLISSNDRKKARISSRESQNMKNYLQQRCDKKFVQQYYSDNQQNRDSNEVRASILH